MAAATWVRGQLEKGQMGGLGLRVDNCRKTYEELSAKGVTFLQEPSERPYGVEAVMRDNTGNWVVLVEPREFSLEDVLAGSADGPLVVSAGLQDPGNLGTLIRSAEAFGATGFIFLPGTVSLYNQKTLRASSGSAFRLPSVAAKAEDLFPALAARGIAGVAAVASDGQAVTGHDLTRSTALILGNEGNGIPPEILRRASARVTIPTPGPVESLNAAVAGSVLLYEAARQRGQR